MAGERSVAGVLAGGERRRGPGLLGLLLAMEAGIPIPVPSDLVMLLLGERVSAGALPLWLAALALELVALAGTAALSWRPGPGRARLPSLPGPRAGPRWRLAPGRSWSARPWCWPGAPVRWTALHVQAGVARGAGTVPPRLVGAVAPVVPG